MIGDLADLQTSLAEDGADVQDIQIGDDQIVVTGTNRGDGIVDTAAVVAAIANRVDLGTPVDLEPRYPEGRVNGTAAEGDSYYVALGDSLAANVGVQNPRDGYVSRFHRWVESLGAGELGLRNFGVPGETSGSLLHAGQLDEAVEFGADNFVRYVTVDIGANDLLGHMTSPDCSEDITAAACAQRIDATLVSYQENIEATFNIVDAAFPDATVVLLTTYNPFGFGFEDRVEFRSGQQCRHHPAESNRHESGDRPRLPGGRRFCSAARNSHGRHPHDRFATRHPPERRRFRPARRCPHRSGFLTTPLPTM